jgi:pimeloyl-ACP methyl ester carboxylesterase
MRSNRSDDLRLPNGRLHVLFAGPETGAPVVCVPGLSANARSFDAIAAALADRGHRVAALDLRGRGLSPATAVGTYGWRRHAEDVLAAAEKLGFATFDVAGHSMGAFVAMQAAAMAGDRIRRVVLIDGAGVPEPAALPPILAAVQRLGSTHLSRETYFAAIRSHGAALPWEELWRDHYLYDLEEVPGGVRARTSHAAVLEDMAYGATHDAKFLWQGLTMPLLVRATRPLGAGFIVGPALRDAFLAAVPSAEAAEVDANHYGVMAHPGTLQAICEFLERRRAGQKTGFSR